MVDSPHEHAEKRVAGAEKLLLLRHEVFFLRFGFAGDGGGEAGSCRGHVSLFFFFFFFLEKQGCQKPVRLTVWLTK